MSRESITVKARNLTEACAMVEKKLKPGDKLFKYATTSGNPDDDGLLQVVFSDENVEFNDVYS